MTASGGPHSGTVTTWQSSQDSDTTVTRARGRAAAPGRDWHGLETRGGAAWNIRVTGSRADPEPAPAVQLSEGRPGPAGAGPHVPPP
jgi:hypothetical protein